MRARLVVGFFFLSAFVGAAGCTSLLGTFDVQPGAGDDGGGTGDGSPPSDGPTGSDAANDAPTDSPTDAGCTAPKPTQCGQVCVNTETDDKHCGACGHYCLGGNCVAHVCLPGLVSARTDVVESTLVATDFDLFFATSANDVIQLPLVGAAPTAITLASPVFQVYALAPHLTEVFFTAATTASGGTFDLWRAVVGTAASGVGRGFSIGGIPVGGVVAGGFVHMANILPPPPETFRILSWPVASGGPAANLSGPGRPAPKLAANNGFIFWSDQLGSSVNAMPDGMGARTIIANAEATPSGPAADGTTVFWADTGVGPNKIRRSPYPAPAAADVRDVAGNFNDIVVDPTNLYYAQNVSAAADELYFVPKAAPPTVAPTRMATGPSIRRLAENAVGLYWADGAGIHVVRKP